MKLDQESKEILDQYSAQESASASEAPRQCFSLLMELENELAGCGERDCFVEGFRLGAGLMLEILVPARCTEGH